MSNGKQNFSSSYPNQLEVSEFSSLAKNTRKSEYAQALGAQLNS